MARRRNTVSPRIARLFLVLWIVCAGLVVYINKPLWRYDYWRYVNLLPVYNVLRLITEWAQEGSLSIWKTIPWLYNFAFYIFPGFIVDVAFPEQKKRVKMIWVCVGFSTMINLARLFTKCGSFDIDDILLNMLGFTVGHFLFIRFSKCRG